MKTVLKKIPGASAFYWKTKKFLKQKKLSINGYKVIKHLQKILERYDVEFFFDMGTLLGIVRESRILSHDMDIDIGIQIEQDKIKLLEEYLKKNGCELKYQRIVEGIGINEDSFIYKGIKFDFNYYQRKENKDCCYILFPNPELETNPDAPNVVELTCSPITGVVKVPFANTEVNIPKNAEEYLTERYGNWRVPDKNWVYWKGPSATVINNKGIRKEL